MSIGKLICVLILLWTLNSCSPADEGTQVDTAQQEKALTAIETPQEITETIQPASATPIQTLTPFHSPLHPILSDIRVRQGIAHCTDKRELIRAVYPYLDDPASIEIDSFVPRDHWAYPSDEKTITRYPFDPARGQALLDEAGWKLQPGKEFRTSAAGDEFRLTLTGTTALFRQTWMEAFEAQMKVCGLHIVRLHVDAEWLYGEDSGLARREFVMAAFAWTSLFDPGGSSLFLCDQIPTPENGWQGQNYTGWCNPAADRALRLAANSLDGHERRQAYTDFQHQFTQDLPWLPLFARLQHFAAQELLRNFAPEVFEVYTWNADRWLIPGRDTIVIGSRSEPSTLNYLESAYITQLLQPLVFGLDYRQSGSDYVPVMLKAFPTLENGGAVLNLVTVTEGSPIVDASGQGDILKPGLRLRDAQGSEVNYEGGSLGLGQLVVRYEFVDGLTWSDGTPVSKLDYELAYRILCDEQVWREVFLDVLPACDQIASVDFASDASYIVTWKPGYFNPLYFLPPIPRLPAHQNVEGGKRLDEMPAEWWPGLDELNTRPLGVGPYTVSRWEFGKEIEFTENPFYYLGAPATPHIVVRFIEQGAVVKRFLQGDVDVFGEDSIWVDDLGDLLEAEQLGTVQLVLLPSPVYEHIEFNLTEQ